MAAASTKTTTPTEIPDFALKMREQFLSTVQQGQQMSLDAAKTFVQAVSALPVQELPTLPGVPVLPAVDSMTTFGFDIAAEWLKSQREFALELASVLAPKATV